MELKFDDVQPNHYYWFTLVNGEQLLTHLVWVRETGDMFVIGDSGGFENVTITRGKVARIDSLRNGMQSGHVHSRYAQPASVFREYDPSEYQNNDASDYDDMPPPF